MKEEKRKNAYLGEADYLQQSSQLCAKKVRQSQYPSQRYADLFKILIRPPYISGVINSQGNWLLSLIVRSLNSNRIGSNHGPKGDSGAHDSLVPSAS